MIKLKCVVKTNEGYFYKNEGPQRVESGIIHSIQLATVFELDDKVTLQEQENDMFVRYLYTSAERDGGTSPRLIKVRILEEE